MIDVILIFRSVRSAAVQGYSEILLRSTIFAPRSRKKTSVTACKMAKRNDFRFTWRLRREEESNQWLRWTQRYKEKRWEGESKVCKFRNEKGVSLLSTWPECLTELQTCFRLQLYRYLNGQFPLTPCQNFILSCHVLLFWLLDILDTGL